MSAQASLDNSVLVLNKYFSAISIVSARQAFTLLFRGAAEVVSHEEDQYSVYDIMSWIELSQLKLELSQTDDDWVRTPSMHICVPRIIRLNIYSRMPEKTVKFNRRNIFARDESRCQYCRERFPMSQLTLDHVVPKSLGGPTTWDNVATACVRCNTRKGGRRPEDAGMKLASNPVRPKKSPVLKVKIRSPKYRCWTRFVGEIDVKIESNGNGTNGNGSALNGHH